MARGKDVFVHDRALCETDDIGARTRVWAFAHVMAGAHIGADCNVGDHVFIENGAWVGNRVTIKNAVLIWDAVRIEDDAFIGPNAVFTNFVNPRSAFKPTPDMFVRTLVARGASIGANATVVAGVTIGGVLEPPGARPVIVEDDAFVGAGSALLEGVLVARGAVIGAGVTLTGTARLYDLVRGRVLEGTVDEPLVVPAGAVVVPGSRTLAGAFAREHGLSVAVALLVKDRDAGTSARVALEESLR